MKKQNLFSTPNFNGAGWSEVTSGERNEIVFERLNKTYGAYEIRTNYDHTLAKAFSAAGLLIVLFSAVYFITNAIPDSIVPIPYLPPIVINPPVIDNPVIPKINPVTQSASSSTDKLKPEVVDDKKIDDKIIPDDPNKTHLGTGNPLDTGSGEPINPISSGGGEKAIDEEPIDAVAVQELPEFPGGETERQHFLQNNLHIPQMIRELGNVKEKVGIVFVVKKDGSIADIAVFKDGSKYSELNNEALRVIKKMPAWIPGRQNGAPVNVRMIMPIQFVVK